MNRLNVTSWLVNIISIKDKTSYFICNDAYYQEKFISILGLKFNGDTAVANRLWLHKEILKVAGYKN